MSFVVNKEIRCKQNEALDEQTQRCEKKCKEGKIFNSNTLSCELNSTNTTCPEGQIFNNHTSSCEDKKVDPTTENGDGTKQDGDGTAKDDDDNRQDDDPHESVYDIKSKETKRTLRKLEETDGKQRIFITIYGHRGDSINFLNSSFLSGNYPEKIKVNDNDISLDNPNDCRIRIGEEDVQTKIEVVWNHKLKDLQYMFNYEWLQKIRTFRFLTVWYIRSY